MVMSHHVGTRLKLGSFERAATVIKHKADYSLARVLIPGIDPSPFSFVKYWTIQFNQKDYCPGFRKKL